MQLIWSFRLLAVIASAVNGITVNPSKPLKNDALTLTATATGPTLTWAKDAESLTVCFVASNVCTVPSPPNMTNAQITINSVTSVSTITISGATQALNGGYYEATGAAPQTVIVSTLPSSVQWQTHPVNGSSVSTGTWIAKTSCVYPETDISMVFTVYVDGVQHSIQSVPPTSSESDSCDFPEKVVSAKLVLESTSYYNKRVYIVANASHDLFPNEPSIEGIPSNVVIFKGQSTDYCDWTYWICTIIIWLPDCLVSGICTAVIVWKKKKAKIILCWLADNIFFCCAPGINTYCEVNATTRYRGTPKLLLVDVLIIGIIVAVVVWLVLMIIVIFTFCACIESFEIWIVAILSFFLSLLAIPLWTAIVLACCKGGYTLISESGGTVKLFNKILKPDLKTKSITYTHEGNVVSPANAVCEGGTRECPWLTLRTVSLNQTGEYVCTINYGPSQQEVHKQDILVTPKQNEVQVGDKIVLLSFLKDLKKYIIDSVEWTHNAKVIPTNRFCYKGGNINNPPLTIKFCSASDSGLYMCTVRTKQSLTPKLFSVQLKIKDEIKVDVGGKLILLQNLNMKNIRDVQWNHKQKPIPNEWRCFDDAENRTCPVLTISLVTACMAGKYQCIVKRTKDEETKVFEVLVKVIDQYTVDCGDCIDLFKDLSSNHGIKKISWELNGNPLKLAGNPSYIGGTKDCPVLTVYCATKTESGKYKCTLTFESQPTKELNIKLDVNEQWHVDSGDSIVLLDKLESSIDGTSVVWTHKKKPVNCFHKGGTDQCPALTIPVVSLEDSGEYECKLKLQHGKIRMYRFVLKVNVQKIKKKVGDKVILLQNLTSAGTIQGINWYKNGRKVPASSDLKYQGGVNQSPGLLVGSLRQDDSGRYECDLIITESHIKLHIPVDLTVEQKENSTRLGPVIRNNRVRDSTENNQSWTEEEQ